MARLPALVDAIAQHDRRGHATIAHISRQVRDVDLIESKKRGAGASVMTFSDATTLLLGAYGNLTPQGAVEAVENMRSLQPSPWDKIDRMKREDLPEELAFLRKRLSFADTVEAMLANAPALAAWQRRYMSEWLGVTQGLTEAEFSMERAAAKLRAANTYAVLSPARVIRVVCYAPGLAAEVHLGRLWMQLEEDDAFHEYYAPPTAWATKRALSDETLEIDPREGALATMEFGLPTLLALHRAVVGK